MRACQDEFLSNSQVPVLLFIKLVQCLSTTGHLIRLILTLECTMCQLLVPSILHKLI